MLANNHLSPASWLLRETLKIHERNANFRLPLIAISATHTAAIASTATNTSDHGTDCAAVVRNKVASALASGGKAKNAAATAIITSK
ncbi:MAG: hypothetical protein ABIW30_03005, partial [Arenimonas sp.]